MKLSDKKRLQKILSFFTGLDYVIVLISLVSLVLRWMIPAQIVPNSPNDDYLGVLLANNLLHGHWLGAWTPNTLSKPPAYSFFLAIAHYIPVDPTVILHLFYLLVALLFINSLVNYFDKLQYRKTFTHLAFLFFAFNPAVFANDFSRIYRTSLDTIATFLFFTLILKLVIFLKAIYIDDRGAEWKKIKILKFLPLSISLGLTFSLMVLTRSEGYWVLVTAIPLVLGVWFTSVLKNSRGLQLRNKYKSGSILVKLFAIALIAYLIPIGLISAINKSFYGVSEIENFYTGNYARAIDLWEGVENGKSKFSFIPVSKGQRAAVYAVSPAALSLKPTLDGSPNTGWKTYNCSATKICDESGSWFPWELRSAAIDNQRITSEVQFQQFFGVLADQISVACSNHQIKCGSAGIAPGAKALLNYPTHQLADTAMKAFGSLFTLDQAANIGHPDNGQDPTELQIWHSTVHFKYLVVQDDFSNWKGMAHTITFLKNLYQGILPILFVLAVLALFVKRKASIWIMNLYAVAVLGAMLVFSGGLAIFESSLGFPSGLSLYGLPMQPLLLVFIAVGIANLVLTSKEIL